MGSEPEDVAKRQALGERLRVYRQLADLTQTQLGRRLYCDRTTVIRLEAGQRNKNREFWQRADDELRADGALLAAFTELESAKTEHARRARAAERAAQQKQVAAWQRELSAPAAAAIASAVPVPQPAPLASCTTTPADLAAIQAMASAFQVADRQVGGGKLYDSVRGYLRSEISPRLFDPASDTLGLHLFAAAASLSELAGWMAHDSGRNQYARRHFGQAYRLALVTDQPALTANVCASMSHLAGQLGEAADAVRIATAGLDHAARSPAKQQLSARLHAMRARGLAVGGDSRQCRDALTSAEQVLDHVSEDQPADWVSHFDEGSLAIEAALCLGELGDLGAAERQARRVLELRSGDRVRSRAFGQLTLAEVLLNARQMEEAAALGREVAAVAASLTSARVKARLADLGSALKPYRSVVGVADFLADCADAENASVVPSEDAWPV